ncbi:MAG: histidine kinase [Terrimicrobiaceae bacterium]|nr:histidine kinase [Terrimicrobiaceae bacterium]
MTRPIDAPRHGLGFGDAIARLLRLPSESVYSKALTLYVGLSLLLGTALVLLTASILLGEFETTERQETIATLQRFNIVLDREVRPIEAALANLAVRLKAGRIPLPDAATLASQQIDFVSVADASGRIVDTVFRDDSARTTFEESRPWTLWILPIKPSGPRAGFILLGDRLTGLAWRPLPGGGSIVAGRVFGQEPFAFLEGMFAARVEFRPLGGQSVSGGDPLIPMLAKNEFVVTPAGPDQIVGRVLLRAINGAPLGEIELRQARPLYSEGLQAVQIFLTALTLASGALFLFVWLLLDRTILRRIRDLTRRVETERIDGRLPLRLEFPGIDELATLARRIEDLAGQLDRERWNYRSVVEDQTEVICRFNAGFGVTFSNGIFRKVFPHNADKGVFLRECLPAAAFDLVATKFAALTPAQPVDTFLQQIGRPGGDGTWFRSTLRALFDESGQRLGGQWVASDITIQVQAQQRLQESERQLRSLSTRLLRLQDDERRRIARELHDSTAQSLSALEMNMSLLEPLAGDEHLRRIVAETRQIARDCCMELRNISYLLHPPLLDEVGLVFAVEWLADGFRKRTGIHVHLDLMPDFPRFDPEVETTLFRVVQESMGNVYRHSGATGAWITLSYKDRLLRMEIRDNGAGLRDGEATTEGVGFAGMRERLAQLRGKIDIRSSPYGLSVVAQLESLPINARPTDQNPAGG